MSHVTIDRSDWGMASSRMARTTSGGTRPRIAEARMAATSTAMRRR
ncbi:MAG: hypothetical protein WKF58_20250 [Ilumatobacteraceae bacterium]